MRGLLMLAALLAHPAAAADCDPGSVELRGPWGQAQFSVEIADSAAERAQGLMHRDRMPRSAGMLFVYGAPQDATFWMKNTLIPLDMIFVGPTGVVLRVHSDAVPLDLTVIEGGPGVAMVLEINGGLARRMGIAEGSEMRHPALDQARAIWPCP